jgi:hypothetical protein
MLCVSAFSANPSRERLRHRFRLLSTCAALHSEGTLAKVAAALEWAYDEAQQQLPRSAALMSDDEVEQLVESSIDFAAKMSLTNIDVQRAAALEHDHALAAINAESVANWGDALDKLRLLRWVAFEEVRDHHREVHDGGALREALLRLHARALTVADEISCLLASGFASGALARWRTLHEFAVTAAFISEHGAPTAERYLAHHVVNRYKHSLEYQRNAAPLGESLLTEAQLEANKQAHDEAIAHFGTSFKNDYGWAAHALGKDRPTFRDIEDAARYGHLRSYYQYASGRVHAGAHGVLAEVADDDRRELIVGAHGSGVTDPLQLTAMSLRAITEELLMATPSNSGIRERIVLAVLEGLYERIGQTLPEARRETDAVGVSDPLTNEDLPAHDRPLTAWPQLPVEDVEQILLDVVAAGEPSGADPQP